MRDPQRIPQVLHEVEKVWKQHPDWRLGQLLCNLADWAERPVWDIEEDELVREIERHLKNYQELTQSE